MRLGWTTDLLAIVGWTGAAAALVLQRGDVYTGPARALVVLPLLVLFPGYALVSMLYPRGRATDGDDRLSAIERVPLSVALSLGIVPLLVFGLNFVTGIYTRPIVAAVAGTTGAFAVLALVSRARVASGERFSPAEFLPLVGTERASGMPGGVFAVLLGGSIALLAVSGAFAAVSEPPSEQFTEFYLLAENDSGELTTEAVPAAARNGGEITAVVDNVEGESVTYTVVVASQQVSDGEVTDESELASDEVELDHGERGRVTYDVSGGGDRLVFRLYRGGASGDAYRTTYVWT